MFPLALSLCTAATTLLGGWFALRFRGRLPEIMAFSAGVLIGLVCFDLLPEIMRQVASGGAEPRAVGGAIAAGFLAFHAMEKLLVIHHCGGCEESSLAHPRVGVLSALALAGHSLMDGVGIGLGFQINWALGLAAGIAVISHDFVDGINTVVVMVGNRNTARQTLPYLALDAAVPIAGVASTFFFRLPPRGMLMALGFFVGFLLYIGASQILPEVHRRKSSRRMLALTGLGALLAFGIGTFA